MKKSDLAHEFGVQYCLGQFLSLGFRAAVLRHEATKYDLAVDKGNHLVRVHVSVACPPPSMRSPSFSFSTNHYFDWIAFLLKEEEATRAWIMPESVAMDRAAGLQVERERTMPLGTLESEPLCIFENNWKLENLQSYVDELLDSLGR